MAEKQRRPPALAINPALGIPEPDSWLEFGSNGTQAEQVSRDRNDESWFEKPLWENEQAKDVSSDAQLGLNVLDAPKLGNGGAAKGASGLSALQTFVTSDPASDGAMAIQERAAMTMIDGIWGFGGGPLAYVDAATGGNMGGAIKGATSLSYAIQDCVVDGFTGDGFDLDALRNWNDNVQDGDFGSVMQEVGGLFDGNDVPVVNAVHMAHADQMKRRSSQRRQQEFEASSQVEMSNAGKTLTEDGTATLDGNPLDFTRDSTDLDFTGEVGQVSLVTPTESGADVKVRGVDADIGDTITTAAGTGEVVASGKGWVKISIATDGRLTACRS